MLYFYQALALEYGNGEDGDKVLQLTMVELGGE